MGAPRSKTVTISHRMQYWMINAAVVTATLIQLIRHRPLVVIIVAALTFAIVGNGTVWLAGTKTRRERRRQKEEYWSE